MDTLRLFYAIPLDTEARAKLADEQHKLREYIEIRNDPEMVRSLRWTSPATFHLTLRFLGETNRQLLEKLSRAGIKTAANMAPFTLKLGKWGAFHRQGFVSVLWLGLSDGERNAAHLADGLSRELSLVGVSVDRRPFQGHLTLARVRRPVKLTLPNFDTDGVSDITAKIDRMVLMQSHLLPTGPLYEEVASFPMTGEYHEQNSVESRIIMAQHKETPLPKSQKQEI